MAYATVFHVEAKNPIRGVYTPNTKPTASQVVQFIHQTAGIIDTVLLKAGYAAPVSTLAASSVLALLEDANAKGAAYYAETAAPHSDREQKYEEMWNRALAMLKSSDLDLAKDAANSNPRGSIASPPFFSRDMTL